MSNRGRSYVCTPIISASSRCLLHALCLLLSLSLTTAHAQERVALVIGNDAYSTDPLTQSRNDAIAMAALLNEAGFVVKPKLDLDLSEMKAAIKSFGEAIRDPRVKFGVFYYSGHGLQQDWHNYLMPVSANVQSAGDVLEQTVDVSTLLRNMAQATGRSFLVVLDACRTYPISGAYRPSAKGLAQMDVPEGSLLAYASRPGTSSWEGASGRNSLYTGALLRGFSRKDINISLQDSFRLVRNDVRLASKGQQLPVELTSLLEDLYLFPNQFSSLTEVEKNQLLDKEISHWGLVRTSKDPEAVAEFIRQHPRGNASELAQSRLNRMIADIAAQEARRLESEANEAAQAAARQRVEEARQEAEKLAAAKAETDRKVEAARVSSLQEFEVQKAAATTELARLASEGQKLALEVKAAPGPTALPPTPVTIGYDEYRRRYSLGDAYNIRVTNQLTGISEPLVMQVTQADFENDRVVYNSGEFVSDFMGNTTSNQRGVFSTPRQFYPAELFVGKKWQTRFKQSRPSGIAYTFQYDLKVVAKEIITVPAGTYETYKIEASGFNIDLGARIERSIWVAPGVNADIAHEIKVRLRNGAIEQNDRQELVSFVQALR